jgi:excisionase family DNA binding protein
MSVVSATADKPDLLICETVNRLHPETIDALAVAVARRVFELMPDPAADPWINAREAAAHLGSHYSTVKQRAAAGELPAYQDSPGGPLWFKRSELDETRRSNG